MNFTDKVVEIKDSQNHAYILEAPELFFSVGYKVLLGQEKNGFIKCTKVSHNGKDKLIYDISKFKTLETLMFSLKLDVILSILINFLDSIILVKNNGFMQCENILVSPDQIFIDCENLSVNLIYLPIYFEADNVSYRIFEKELKINLSVILKAYNEQNPYINAIYENMMDSDFTLEDVHASLKDLQLKDYASLNQRVGKKKNGNKGLKGMGSNDKFAGMKKRFLFGRKK
ncbi:hypothetical protein SAMN02745136_03119 [Anaerocolumna jejuensis DSM 15929]|uniref:DUF6382 domain-containing protein n=1 Tax=Anaerocolumna jejuensis DSM 15929 TaxID=1121322 RepID=A0A1M6UJL2_9FIRM|nr:DUF6382 domain-containing protein [Anaerocolumna jejuensis]SHK69424.1 hypothetical protein SAMN02745136_03119 [Anaerocolumna jejuensis DSM 15929]